KQEIAYLEDLLVQIEHARDEDLEDIRTELQDEGYIKKQKKKKKKTTKPMPEKITAHDGTPIYVGRNKKKNEYINNKRANKNNKKKEKIKKKKKKKKKTTNQKPEKFTAHDGTPIYVGRNNKQNEYVTHKLANKNDMWLHTLDIPGSHIIIKSNNPTQETIEEAAILSAHYSKAQGSASVPVDYTQVKYVKKPSGAKPGFVTYSNQKTLYVTPTEELVQALRENNEP